MAGFTPCGGGDKRSMHAQALPAGFRSPVLSASHQLGAGPAASDRSARPGTPRSRVLHHGMVEDPAPGAAVDQEDWALWLRFCASVSKYGPYMAFGRKLPEAV